MKLFSAVIASLALVASCDVKQIIVEATADTEDPAKEKLSIGGYWYTADKIAGVSWYTNDPRHCSPNTVYSVCIKIGNRSGFNSCGCKNCREFTVKSDSSGNAGESCTKLFPMECGLEHTVMVKIKGKKWKWARDKRSVNWPCDIPR